MAYAPRNGDQRHSESQGDLSLEALKLLARDRLGEFTRQLRGYIIETVRERGGHLGASLGVIELTAALHYVFDSPADRFVWDTGHQAYAHKIITNREKAFKGLRTQAGLSGFPQIKESIHDAFGTGHASTSIAAAFGIASSQALRASGGWTLAIVGDAAFAGGPAFEAINVAANSSPRLCVVLNDNGYSISPNVGGLYSHRPSSYRDFARALGIDYVGPMNGHDVDELVEVFGRVKAQGTMCLVHVVTEKGHGYLAAERDPLRLHAIVSRFGTSEGAARPNTKSLQSIVVDKLTSYAATDARVKVVTPGMGAGAGLTEFGRRFPHQFFDVGIGEGTALTLAAGLAAAGDKPVVHIYSTFLQRATDQLIHDIGLQQLPVTLIVDRVGLCGEDGPTHHGVYDLALLTAAAGFTVYSISCAEDLDAILALLMREARGPSAIRLSKATSVPWENSAKFRDSRSDFGTIRYEGNDATIITHGRIGEVVQQAANTLASQGIHCRVVDCYRVCPVDEEDLKDFLVPGKPALVVEEHVGTGSLGQRMLPLCSQLSGTPRVDHLFIRNPVVPHASIARQLEICGLIPQAIVDRVHHLTGGGSTRRRPAICLPVNVRGAART